MSRSADDLTRRRRMDRRGCPLSDLLCSTRHETNKWLEVGTSLSLCVLRKPRLIKQRPQVVPDMRIMYIMVTQGYGVGDGMVRRNSGIMSSSSNHGHRTPIHVLGPSLELTSA